MRLWPHRRRRLLGKRNAASGGPRPYRPALECLEDRCLPSAGYVQVNLASDVPGLARVTDPNLVNPWGISFSPTGPFWFADNGSGVSDLLDGRGGPVPLVVAVPPTAGSAGTPTGTVFNGGAGFIVSGNGVSAPSRFLFATEDGTISGWSAVVDPTRALLAVDNSSSGAVYKGLALATDPAGRTFLYAADFGRGTVDVFDENFHPVARPGSFQDPNLPGGFAPFNVQSIHNLLFVTYAQQDEARRDDVRGEGHGFIDVYDTDGNLLRRFASRGALDSPWGLALAPAGFGPFGGALLVGNTGDGHINAYDPGSGAFLGPLAGDNGIPITVPTLWALTFGNGHLGGDSDTLFFTAGVGDEEHGLFAAIQAPGRRGADTAGAGTFDPDAPGEPDDYPLPPSGGPSLQGGEDPVLVTAVLLPWSESSLALVPTLSAVPPPWVRAAPDVPPSYDRSVPTPPLAFGSTSLLRAADDPLPAWDTQTTSLALNAFLDLSPPQVLPEYPARGQPPDTNRDTAGAGSSPSARGDAGAEGLSAEPQIAYLEARSTAEEGPEPPPASGRGDKVVARIPSEDPAESAGDPPPENEKIETQARGTRTRLVKRLLVAVSVPMVWGVLKRLLSSHGSHPGKALLFRRNPRRGASRSRVAP